MKEITIKNRTFQYEVFESTSEWGDSVWTEFYDGFKTVKKRKWGLFGSYIEVKEPNRVFTIHEDANNPKKSKKWWWKRISKEIDLLERSQEISSGNLTFAEEPKPDKGVYDKNACPFPGSEYEWSDFCDWINREGEYSNMDPNQLSFPKSFFLISTNR